MVLNQTNPLFQESLGGKKTRREKKKRKVYFLLVGYVMKIGEKRKLRWDLGQKFSTQTREEIKNQPAQSDIIY